MADHFPVARAAWRRLNRNLRILACEEFTALALKIAPDDYVPAIYEGVIAATREYDSRAPVGDARQPGE